MKVVDDFKKNKKRIMGSVKRWGYSPEHNYFNAVYKETKNDKPYFFDFGYKKGILAMYDQKENSWYDVFEVLAPEKERISMFMEFLNFTLRKMKSKRVSVEVGTDFRQQIFSRIKRTKYKTTHDYNLYWPVYDVEKFDGKLGGKRWKKLRNIRNRFYNQFKVEYKTPKQVKKEQLASIMHNWMKRRSQNDEVDQDFYMNMINNNFEGFDMTRVISLNGRPCSISAGWQIPNSNDFYYGIGLFDYCYKDVGEFVNTDDILQTKKMGFSRVDLGGSDKSLLYFKKKLKPSKIYKTHIFNISRKK